MKPAPIDREAADLFTLTIGMRAWCRIEGAEVVLRFLAKDPVTLHAHAYAEGLRLHLTESLAHSFYVAAFDTDDPATVGVMLAQLDAEAGGLAVSVVDRVHERTFHGTAVTRFAVHVTTAVEYVHSATGSTLGAALVAAMRALKGAK